MLWSVFENRIRIQKLSSQESVCWSKQCDYIKCIYNIYCVRELYLQYMFCVQMSNRALLHVIVSLYKFCIT